MALVAGWLARSLPKDARIAAVFPDGPQRYLGTVYDDAYCAAHGLLDSPPAPEPDLIGRPDEKEVTRWTRCTAVTDPLALAEGRAMESDHKAGDVACEKTGEETAEEAGVQRVTDPREQTR